MTFTTTRGFRYHYLPGIADLAHPTAIKGQPIKSGAWVRLAREFNPPMYPTKVFCMIEDLNGNVMSVYKAAVVKFQEVK